MGTIEPLNDSAAPEGKCEVVVGYDVPTVGMNYLDLWSESGAYACVESGIHWQSRTNAGVISTRFISVRAFVTCKQPL